MFVCVCRQVKESDIAVAIDNGAATFAEIQYATGTSTCCGQCRDFAEEVSDALLTAKLFHNAA